MTEVAPFKIDIADEVLDDLRRRLRNTRWPESELVDDWSQGIPLSYVKDVCSHWADGYDWRKREAALNRFDQFTTKIDGVDIHFVHVRSPNPDALPLFITHGWPGSIVEFHKVIEPLADPAAHGGDAADAFHVVYPSLPGYGFSGKPPNAGWGVEKFAEVWAELASRLGYDRYGAQGGDWGSAVTAAVGRADPEHCVGVHMTLNMGARPTGGDDDPTPEEQRAHAGLKHYIEWDSGYSQQQATRPQTLGYGLTDSPAGQAAWIIEKFWSWTDCGRSSRERAHQRRAARQRDALLGQCHRNVVGASLLGELPPATGRHGRHPLRFRRVSQRDRAASSEVVRGGVHRHSPLGRNATRRPLRRFRSTGAVRRRCAHVLRPGPVTTTGFLHPGEMGSSLAAACAGTTLWCSGGRSEATRRRASLAGISEVASLEELVGHSDVIVSVCPPAAAYSVADEVQATGFAGTYVDANAIAPATARRISELFERFVDGGVIGPPVTAPGSTRLYLSGADHPEIAELWRDSDLSVRVVDGGAGAASAVKACFASWTKGSALAAPRDTGSGPQRRGGRCAAG